MITAPTKYKIGICRNMEQLFRERDDGSGYSKEALEKYKELQPLIIYSQWQGYIKDKGAEYYKEDLARLCTQYPTVQLHTSGHASKKVIEAIIRLVDAHDYTAVIHSEMAELINRSSFG